MGVLVCLVFLGGLYGVLERESGRERHIYIYICRNHGSGL